MLNHPDVLKANKELLKDHFVRTTETTSKIELALLGKLAGLSLVSGNEDIDRAAQARFPMLKGIQRSLGRVRMKDRIKNFFARFRGAKSFDENIAQSLVSAESTGVIPVTALLGYDKAPLRAMAARDLPVLSRLMSREETAADACLVLSGLKHHGLPLLNKVIGLLDVDRPETSSKALQALEAMGTLAASAAKPVRELLQQTDDEALRDRARQTLRVIEGH